MALYEWLPYTNFHEINLDWMIRKIKAIEDQLGDLDPEAIQKAVNEYLEAHPELFPFVIPQMFGAVADGEADDTAAIQRAVDAGIDVYFPTDHGEIYKISAPIQINRGKARKLYGAATARGTASAGVIKRVYDSAQDNSQSAAMFRLGPGVEGIHFANLRFILGDGDDANSGVFLDAKTFKQQDKDVYIRNCSFKNAYEAIQFDGRGLTVVSSSFGSCSTAAVITWDSSLGTDLFGSRAIKFDSCRFHAMTGAYAVRVDSGHAYGLQMINCLADRWLHGLIYAAETAYNWMVSGCTTQQAYRAAGAECLIRLEGGAEDCNISDNIFRCSSTGSGPLNNLIYMSGDVTGCVISSNVFDNTHQSAVRISGGGNTAGNVISNNTFMRNGDADNSTYAMIQINNMTQKGYVISGNTCAGAAGTITRLLASSNVGALTFSTILGNVCGSIPTAGYTAANCQVTGNVANLT